MYLLVDLNFNVNVPRIKALFALLADTEARVGFQVIGFYKSDVTQYEVLFAFLAFEKVM